uniref:Glucuronosyltransferase n=1 Tax=Panagrolaimus sp. JU765 TaxID=591449 RepID=A0AC34RG32_9BILA
TVLIPELETDTSPISKSAKIVVRKWNEPEKKLFVDHQDYIWGNRPAALWMREVTANLMKNLNKQCENLLTDQEFIAKLKQEKFDFGLIESIDFCGIGLFKLLGIKEYAIETPMAISGKLAAIHGLPGRSSTGFPSDVDNHPELTFYERLLNFIDPFFHLLIHNPKPFNEQLVQKHVDPEFDADEALANARIVFVNSEEHLDFPRAISHKIVYIGGITVNQKFDLPPEYAEIFNSASKGVVLVSFGSLALSKDMPAQNKQSLLKMFAAFPQINFIWKYEDLNDTIGEDLPNVFKFKWVDRTAILNQEKTIGFVTHGGMNSVSEAGHFGVPLLAVPLFADQYRNAKMLEFRKTA